MPELLCPWEASEFFIFSSNVPALIHYSHWVATVSALGMGLFIFAHNPKGFVPRLILLFVSLFSVWAMLDVMLWATNRPDTVMFSWSLQVLIEPLTYALAFYLFYLYLYKQWPSFRTNVLIFILLLPLLVFLPTTLNLEALSLSACEAIEGPLAKYYTYIVHTILVLAIAVMGARKIPGLPTRRERLVALFFGLGLVTFLLSFTSGNIMGSFTDDWTLSQYGLFGMPVFAALIAYSIVQFKAFNAKVIGAQMLVIILAIAVISLVTLQEITSVRVVAALTFVLVCALGYILVKSVKREVAQREHIEKLAGELEQTNKRQEGLLHFIGHEVKGFLTKDQGAFAALSEGDAGHLDAPAQIFVKQALAQTREGVQSVTDLLQASNQKSGTVTYKKETFDFKALVAETVEKLRPSAEKKGLSLTLKVADGMYAVTGDKEKLGDNVLRNLIDNAINYTPQGSVEVSLTKRDGKAIVAVKDTGVGISDEDKAHLFTEGGKGKDSNKINVHSTGYGLFIAKGIVEAHKGTIRAESEGPGNGSTFVVELPV